MLEFHSRKSGVLVAGKVEKADTFWGRFIGLLGRKSLAPGHGLWLVPGASIHTWFMAFPIDAVFLDKDLKVLRVATLPPWKMTSWVRGAHSVLELPESGARGLEPGDVLETKEAK